jgi:hypothetical protein
MLNGSCGAEFETMGIHRDLDDEMMCPEEQRRSLH